ncbi:hypothetical protein AB0B31_10900 [Catellatospora citrea]|uniref:hypothetical protein n=1 Tax=Catellatospora citrea TaxID=53366 RepID=UPI0033D800AD
MNTSTPPPQPADDAVTSVRTRLRVAEIITRRLDAQLLIALCDGPLSLASLVLADEVRGLGDDDERVLALQRLQRQDLVTAVDGVGGPRYELTDDGRPVADALADLMPRLLAAAVGGMC